MYFDPTACPECVECYECVDAFCCAELAACSESDDCAATADCIFACDFGDQACNDACQAANLTGYSLLESYALCQSENCAAPCNLDG